METIAISSVVGIVLFAIGVFCGKVSPCSHDIYPIHCGHCCGKVICSAEHNYWKNNCWEIPSGKTLAQAEAEMKAENRGYERGYERGLMEKVFNSSSSRKDEFLARFSDAIKPIEELKKEYKIK